MADVKKVRISYLLELDHEEFQLLFRSIGATCGAKVQLKPDDVVALREVNAKLAKIRAATIRQMAGVADRDAGKAQDLLDLPIDEVNGRQDG